MGIIVVALLDDYSDYSENDEEDDDDGGVDPG